MTLEEHLGVYWAPLTMTAAVAVWLVVAAMFPRGRGGDAGLRKEAGMPGLVLARHHGQKVIILTPAGEARRITIEMETRPNLRLRIIADPEVVILRGELEDMPPAVPPQRKEP